ncbi:GNAT family N-acetyltransferase [Thermoleptolyngbya sichuanensis A183]|uniref:GNAT family N-acetyltransferase n=2 Tax=Oculatellaceae TaxID=2303507 RepID=A0A6M8BFM4_9CYAN|nr:GNAT family N-acetyltransferase [Thermoleptolyngbya sichuanensis A183]
MLVEAISQEMSLKDPLPQNLSLDKTSTDTSPNRASPTKPALGEVLGAFYLKPNFPGWCSHICNAGFIVQPAMRGQGIGRWMAETMLAIAPTKGYTAVMFNLVFATNEPSLNLWRSLGFSTLGRVPQAARLPDGASVDAIMLYRAL